MKTHHYLTSGILEAYLLGVIAEKEKDELERELATDPDLLAQLDELEANMEDYFIRNSVTPPPSVREKIELRLSETEIEKWEDVNTTEPNPKAKKSQSTESPYVQVEIDDTHIRVHKLWRTAFIAVFILSKVFLILGLYYYFKSSSLEQEVDRLKATTQSTHSAPR
ncbi:hypothetical protein [Spirosoma validum]|uniref:Anti-sigma factor n=1 Tax=Spirosoma validum TaxID=2771355 RepID=A0A927B9A5_9BACT|nr:hypothetical protein [Spirosoma validum]MBD2757546.1 hypothetical protein [Spirosoma validum]